MSCCRGSIGVKYTTLLELYLGLTKRVAKCSHPLPLSHPTIAGGVFWAICCTKFQVKVSLETATVVRTRSILICNAHPYCLAPFKTKYKRTARAAGGLTHFQALFFEQSNPPLPLSWDDSKACLMVTHSHPWNTKLCENYVQNNSSWLGFLYTYSWKA